MQLRDALHRVGCTPAFARGNNVKPSGWEMARPREEISLLPHAIGANQTVRLPVSYLLLLLFHHDNQIGQLRWCPRGVVWSVWGGRTIRSLPERSQPRRLRLATISGEKS